MVRAITPLTVARPMQEALLLSVDYMLRAITVAIKRSITARTAEEAGAARQVAAALGATNEIFLLSLSAHYLLGS